MTTTTMTRRRQCSFMTWLGDTNAPVEEPPKCRKMLLAYAASQQPEAFELSTIFRLRVCIMKTFVLFLALRSRDKFFIRRGCGVTSRSRGKEQGWGKGTKKNRRREIREREDNLTRVVEVRGWISRAL